MTRKAVSKKLRFEVFKRDSFTCQYCGAKAPEVALHADHVKPVAEGGTSDILNLITACIDCNAGKGKRELSDNAALSKQMAQMTALNERREQIEMMAEWRSGLEKLEQATVAMAEEAWSKAVENRGSLTDHGRQDLAKLVKRHGLEAVFNGISASATSYLRRGDDGLFTVETMQHAFLMIGRVISVQKRSVDKPYLQRLFYARGILRNRLQYVNEIIAMQIMDDAVIAGADPESIVDLARTVSSWTRFRDAVEEFTADQRANQSSVED